MGKIVSVGRLSLMKKYSAWTKASYIHHLGQAKLARQCYQDALEIGRWIGKVHAKRLSLPLDKPGEVRLGNGRGQ